MEIPSLVCCVMKPRSPIENPSLHEVGEEKVEGWIPPCGQVAVLEALPECEMAGDLRCVAQASITLRLPAGIVHMLIKKASEPPIVAVIDRHLNLAKSSVENGVFMDLHVEPAPFVFLDALVEGVAGAEQSELALRETVAEGLSQEMVSVSDPVAVAVVFYQRSLQSVAEGLIDEFICI